jgi:Lipase (class 3)
MNRKIISFSFLLALTSVVLGNTNVKAESFAQRCQSNRSDCDAIYDSSKLIDPTYDKNEKTRKEEISKLGWDKDKTSLVEAPFFIDPKDPNANKKVAIDAQAIISQKEVNGKTVYLFSFRGTEDPGKALQAPGGKVGTDGGTDANIGLTEFGVGKVHTGFLDYVTALEAKPQFRTVMKEILDKQIAGKPYEVIVTGHSLGGAAAQLFAARLVMSNGVEESKIKNIVFGSPSVGDKSFTETYLRNTLRVEINLDGIPKSTKVANALIPSWLKGGEYYHDYGKVIQATASEKTIQKWNEYTRAIQELSTKKNLFNFAEIDGKITRLEFERLSLTVTDAHMDYPVQTGIVC